MYVRGMVTFFFVLNRLGTGMMVLRRDLSSMEVELDIEGLIDVLLRFDLFFYLVWIFKQ